MDKFVSIFKFNQHTFVLENTLVSEVPVFMAKILSHQIKPDVALTPAIEKAPLVARTFHSFRSPGKDKRLQKDVNRVLGGKLTESIVGICQKYAENADSYVGRSCHSTVIEFLRSSENRVAVSKGSFYTLIAWALVHTPLEVSNTYPLVYTKKVSP